MNPRSLYSLIAAFIMLSTLSSCKNSQAPVVNPPAVETSLASTALAFAKQTESANPRTATPSPTPADTPTPTPQVSVNGTSLLKQEDGSALFVDHKAGIQLQIPEGWLPLRVNEDEYYQAFTSDIAASNPAISERLTQIQDADLKTFRLDAIDTRDGHTVNGILSDINVIFYAGDNRNLEQLAQAEAKRKFPFKNYMYFNRGYPKLENGTRVLLIERTWSKDQTGKVFNRAVFYPLPSGVLELDLYSNKEFKDTILPEFEQLVNSVVPLNS